MKFDQIEQKSPELIFGAFLCKWIGLTRGAGCSINVSARKFPRITATQTGIMKINLLAAIVFVVACSFAVRAQQTPQQKEAARIATRDRLGQLLAASGPKKGIELAFAQSTKNPFNYVVIKKAGLVNSQSMEVVISVTNDETIGFRIYPYYNGSYVNIDKAKNGPGLMRKLLNLSHKNFLFWGSDDGGDIFAGYTFTMESGFPDKAIEIVLYSIAPLDQYVGEMRPFIDGTSAPVK
jgi:hypothetical protein